MGAQASKEVDCLDKVGFSLAVGTVQKIYSGRKYDFGGFIVSKVAELNLLHIHSAVAISGKILFFFDGVAAELLP